MDVIQNIGGVELPAMFGKLVNENGAPDAVPVPKIVAPAEPETVSAD
jgi:hypothetical protein